jgi:hypothetical protein
VSSVRGNLKKAVYKMLVRRTGSAYEADRLSDEDALESEVQYLLGERDVYATD